MVTWNLFSLFFLFILFYYPHYRQKTDLGLTVFLCWYPNVILLEFVFCRGFIRIFRSGHFTETNENGSVTHHRVNVKFS